MGSTDMRAFSCTLALAVVAVAAVAMFAQADELKDLSSADVAPQVDQKDVNLGEGAKGFFNSAGSGTGTSMDNALLTSGTFTMMSSNGLEEEEELGESEGGFFNAGSGTGTSMDTALLTSGSFLMMSSNGL